MWIYTRQQCNMKTLKQVCKKFSIAIYIIHRIKNIVDRKEAILIYYAHFHSISNYDIILWLSLVVDMNVFLK